MREVYTERIAPSFILGLFIKEFAIRGNPDAVKLNDLLVFLPSKNCVKKCQPPTKKFFVFPLMGVPHWRVKSSGERQSKIKSAMSALMDTEGLKVTPKYWIQFNSIQNDSEPP